MLPVQTTPEVKRERLKEEPKKLQPGTYLHLEENDGGHECDENSCVLFQSFQKADLVARKVISQENTRAIYRYWRIVRTRRQ